MSTNEAGPDETIGASPTRIINPEMRFEAARALVWVGVVGLAVLAIYVSQALLVIFGALVFAALIDGGARLLHRALPIGRGWRVGLVLLGTAAFFIWLGYFAGSQISRQAAAFPDIISTQLDRGLEWLRGQGFAVSQENVSGMMSQAVSGAGTITRAIGGVIGGLASVIIILVIGIYVAAEPRLYERGLAWMVPQNRRSELHATMTAMASTMRRLMAGRLVGMVVEGVFTYIMLVGYGIVTGDEIPMAALLAILTGVLAFVPNIGAFISGVLLALVGFSGGVQMGIYAIVVYLLVQNIDGYVVIPMIARKTVDLAPALVLGFQLIMGILFGILGLLLADPLLAMVKVALERRAAANQQAEDVDHARTPYAESMNA